MTRTMQQTNVSKAILEGLRQEVANAIALYLNYKKYHWQVSGPLFRDLHLLFDDHATQILAGVDELGERVRILGGLAPHTPEQVAQIATVRLSPEGEQAPRQMIQEALENHEVVIKGMKTTIEDAAGNGDPGTADLLTRLIQVHEKQAWFLREVAARESSML